MNEAFSVRQWVEHLLVRLHQIAHDLSFELAGPLGPDSRFADVLDSMAMLEFLTLIALDSGVSLDTFDRAMGGRYTTVARLAEELHAMGLAPFPISKSPIAAESFGPSVRSEARGAMETPIPGGDGRTIRLDRPTVAWLAGTTARLPAEVQPATEIDSLIGHPAGWLERHAGIISRRVWQRKYPLDEAADAAETCLRRAGLTVRDIRLLIVTSEAPSQLVGQAAALHHHLKLGPAAMSLEVGGACTGFLASLLVAARFLPQVNHALVVCVESPSWYLRLESGPGGETAALFGDAVAAAVLSATRPAGESVALYDIVLLTDGSGASLLRVVPGPAGGTVRIEMDGDELALRAITLMGDAVERMLHRHMLNMADLSAIIAHGGNGWMPRLLARRLGVPEGFVWSEVARCGNLGSASLPVAWAERANTPTGPVIWVAVGAGLTCGVALTQSV